MARKSVVFDDWSAGEYGTLTTSAPKGSFTGANVLRYFDGSIGPRPGLKLLPVTGVPAGTVRGFGKAYQTNTAANHFYVNVGTAVYGIDGDSGGAASTYTGALAATPQEILRETQIAQKNFTWVSSLADKSYRLDHVNKTVTALTGSPGGRAITMYGVRLMVGGPDSGFPQRLYFSAAGDFSSWPARNYIDIGDGDTLGSLYVLRSRLLIGKTSSWYVLTGVPGVNDSVREVYRDFQESCPRQERGVLTGGQIWFNAVDADFPSSFNGTTSHALRHLTTGQGSSDTVAPPAVTTTSVQQQGEFVYLKRTQALVHFNNAWTRHTLGLTTSGAWVSNFGTRVGMGAVGVCDGGGASTVANFYHWPITMLNRPVIAGNAGESAGDGTTVPVDASFSPPQWWEPHGLDVRVNTVIVDFVSYATGNTATNHFDLTVNALRRYEQGGDQDSDTQDYDEAPSASSTTGTAQRRQFNFGGQLTGAGFELTLSAIRGVAIKRISVIYDETALVGAR